MSDLTFAKRIAAMNAMYKLPAQPSPVLPSDPADRLRKFKATLLDEVNEIDVIATAVEGQADPLDVLVAVADLLGDVIVYCRSEALKYGIPLGPPVRPYRCRPPTQSRAGTSRPSAHPALP